MGSGDAVMSCTGTDLGADAGGADDGEEGVGFGAYGHLHPGETLRQLLLILLCRAYCIHKHLKTHTHIRVYLQVSFIYYNLP